MFFFFRFYNIQLNDNSTVRLEKSSVEVKHIRKMVHVEDILPNVIEPSFGISRIMYVILEHCFRQRENEESNSYFAFSALIAPLKCSILPLNTKSEFQPFIKQICKLN